MEKPLLLKSPLRFSTGSIVFTAGERWIIALPDERILSVQPDAASVEIVADVLQSRISPAEAHARFPESGVDGLVDALVEKGALSNVITSPATQTDPVTETARPQRVSLGEGGMGELEPTSEDDRGKGAGGRMVVVVGDRHESGSFVRAAAHAGLHAIFVDEYCDTDPATIFALVGVARWLPDRRWQEIDDWCQRHGVPWHRMHGEGRRWYVGPFSVPGRSASYGDLRLRRLAASPCPEDLLLIWRWLDGGGVPADEPTELTQWAQNQALALVVHDLLAHRQALASGAAEDVAGGLAQVGIDYVTQTHRAHRVFAVPRNMLQATP